MEELEVVQRNYETGLIGINPKKAPIQNALTSEFKKLYETNLKNKLNQWRYFKEDNKDIEDLQSGNLNNLQYLNVIENHISSLIHECRSKLTTELKDIEFCARKKENDKKRSERGDKKECVIEEKVLKRLNIMPEDVVGVIGEFLFGPNMRHLLITSKYLPDLFLFKKVRMPKLKIMARIVALDIQVIGQKIMKNKHIMNSIPFDHEQSANIYAVANCRKLLRETVKKPVKISEIRMFVENCEQAIQTIERIGFPNTTRNCYALLNKIYHLIILASKPENNKRRPTSCS